MSVSYELCYDYHVDCDTCRETLECGNTMCDSHLYSNIYAFCDSCGYVECQDCNRKRFEEAEDEFTKEHDGFTKRVEELVCVNGKNCDCKGLHPAYKLVVHILNSYDVAEEESNNCPRCGKEMTIDDTSIWDVINHFEAKEVKVLEQAQACEVRERVKP